MSLFTVFAVLITATALLSYVNERLLRLPQTIGVMIAALVCSILLLLAGKAGLGVENYAEQLMRQVDFGSVLMNGMLSFLLFAGALHVNLEDLLDRKWTILILATFGVVLSTFLVGGLIYLLLGVLGIELSFGYALIFGALISPTDPIAVLGILRKAGAPKSLESVIIGESLFNDGVGVVVFGVITGLVAGGHELSAQHVFKLFAEEALGGAALGLALGYAAYRMLRSVDQYMVEILLTLALVSGGYVLAGYLHTSGPIAMVVAGLFIGNHGRVFAMSDDTREHLDTFWELLDEILNALLFVMIGFELLILDLRQEYLLLGVLAIPITLVVRFSCVGLPILMLKRFRSYPPRTVSLMTWGGIRGGISIALALSLADSTQRDLILVVTYIVVVFSIMAQGLSVGRAVRWATAGRKT